MQTQQTTPLAPYGSMAHLALVAKVGDIGKGKPGPGPSITPTSTVVRRATAQ